MSDIKGGARSARCYPQSDPLRVLANDELRPLLDSIEVLAIGTVVSEPRGLRKRLKKARHKLEQARLLVEPVGDARTSFPAETSELIEACRQEIDRLMALLPPDLADSRRDDMDRWLRLAGFELGWANKALQRAF